MNFQDLVGMYRVAINRCVDIIACGEESINIEEIFNVVDGSLTMINGDNDLFQFLGLDDEQKTILYKYSHILSWMLEVEKDIKKFDFQNMCYFENQLGKK